MEITLFLPYEPIDTSAAFFRVRIDAATVYSPFYPDADAARQAICDLLRQLRQLDIDREDLIYTNEREAELRLFGTEDPAVSEGAAFAERDAARATLAQLRETAQAEQFTMRTLRLSPAGEAAAGERGFTYDQGKSWQPVATETLEVPRYDRPDPTSPEGNTAAAVTGARLAEAWFAEDTETGTPPEEETNPSVLPGAETYPESADDSSSFETSEDNTHPDRTEEALPVLPAEEASPCTPFFTPLRPLGLADRERLQGREREIEDLYEMTFDHRLLLLYGPPQVGKTSLWFSAPHRGYALGAGILRANGKRPERHDLHPATK